MAIVMRDTAEVFDSQGLDPDTIVEQARGILEDVTLSAWKVGFLGSAEGVSAVAEIISAGLLGDKYMSLVPGGSDKVIPPGGKITYTQSSVSLENLIGQMMFSAPGPKKEGEGEAPKPPGGAAPAPAAPSHK